MSPTQQTILIVGVILAVGVYLVVKLFQWRRRRQANDQYAPRRREAAKATPVATTMTSGATPVSVASVKAPAVAARRSAAWSSDPHADADDFRFGGATGMLADLMPHSPSSRESLLRALRNAGYYSPHAWENFAAVRYLCLMAPMILFGVLLILVPESLEPWMIAGIVVGGILGWALPALYVRSRAAERLREMESGMPDMLDLLNMCVSQGMTVPRSLDRVGREIEPIYPALSKELSIVADQARVGSLSQALTNFNRRVDVSQVHSFTSLLIQTEQMGTSVSDSLADYSDSMRETLRQRADEKANSATFKLLFPTVICLMPAVFLFLMGPAVVELNRFFAAGGIDGVRAAANSSLQQPETNN